MFHVMRGGCTARHPYPFHLSRMHGIKNYVLLFIHTAVQFQIDGNKCRTRSRHLNCTADSILLL